MQENQTRVNAIIANKNAMETAMTSNWIEI